MIEPTEELWAIVDEDDNIMVSCKLDRWTKSKVVKRNPLVYTSEKNAQAGLRQYCYGQDLRVKQIRGGET